MRREILSQIRLCGHSLQQQQMRSVQRPRVIRQNLRNGLASHAGDNNGICFVGFYRLQSAAQTQRKLVLHLKLFCRARSAVQRPLAQIRRNGALNHTAAQQRRRNQCVICPDVRQPCAFRHLLHNGAQPRCQMHAIFLHSVPFCRKKSRHTSYRLPLLFRSSAKISRCSGSSC